MTARYLLKADDVLRTYEPAEFDSDAYAYAQCIEIVRAVEDERSWELIHPSIERFYATYEDRHPDIRLYGVACREITAGTSPRGESASETLARLRAAEYTSCG